VDRWNPAHARYGRAPLGGHSRTLAQVAVLVRFVFQILGSIRPDALCIDR
jgi:hypothetical protein